MQGSVDVQYALAGELLGAVWRCPLAVSGTVDQAMNWLVIASDIEKSSRTLTRINMARDRVS
jgi:hypothetical protein